MAGLEPPSLCRLQPLVGESKLVDDPQRLARQVQALLEPRALRPHRRDASLLRPHGLQRVIEDAAPLGVALGHPVRAQQAQRLVALEPVAHSRVGHGLLLVVAERAECVRHRNAEAPLVQTPLERLGQLLGEREPLHHPPALAPAQLCDGGRAQLVIVPEAPHHACLVHG